jgi:acetylornithine deacetylase
MVRINSVNPFFGDDAPGEGPIAEYLAGLMKALGLEVQVIDAAPGRPNVLGWVRGTGEGRSLMLNGHIDTVSFGGMDDPLSAEIRDGKMYGRGAYDMKCGVAACLGAAKALVDAGVTLPGDLVVAAVADEEDRSLGTSSVIEHFITDGAIITEPSGMILSLAHRGFVWMEIETTGRAAHGSRPQDGIDANMHMGRVLGRLETLGRDLQARAPHPLAGCASLHAAMLKGGEAPSIYSPRCTLQIEWRTAPTETTESVLGEVQAMLDELAAEDANFSATVREVLTRPPFATRDHSALAPIAHGHRDAVYGSPSDVAGVLFWTDAALTQAKGIDSIILGPTGVGAHADVEWVELDSVVKLTHVLARTAVEYCR